MIAEISYFCISVGVFMYFPNSTFPYFSIAFLTESWPVAKRPEFNDFFWWH